MLQYTPKEIKERKSLVVNPAKTCQPIGAMYAALGIHRCLPHSHGSQGCCSYHRMHLTRHYRDPIVASTSSFTEGACVFGGKADLSKGLQNVFAIYDPDIVAREYHLPVRDHRRRYRGYHPLDRDTRGQGGHPCQYPQLRGGPM